MTKVVFFAFRPDPICFEHILLNVLDLEEQGMWGEVVFEGEATRLIPEISQPEHHLYPLFTQARDKGLIYGVCEACSTKMEVSEAIRAENIHLVGDLKGHPSLSEFIKQEYSVIVF